MPRYALIVADMLNEFVTGGLAVRDIRRIIPEIKLLLKAARASGAPVFYTNDAHVESDAELAIWGRHAMKDTEGSRIIPELAPEKGDYIFEKHSYSAFQSTDLDLHLRSLSVTAVVLTGTMTHICIMSTAADAFYRGYGIIVAEDGVADNDPGDHDTALRYMRELYNVKILHSGEISKLIGSKT